MRCASAGWRVEQTWLMSKHDIVHETGSTYRVTAPPDEDRATAIGNMHNKISEYRGVVPKI